MKRRIFLAMAPLVAGCSVLPDRPFIATRRFPLAPTRPADRPRGSGTRPALMIRTMRAAPGLEERGLRRVRADGTLDLAFYDEWLAPPADLAEAALREWLVASRIFAAVAAPGSRLTTPLTLEPQLVALQAEPGLARAGMSLLLLGDRGGETPRVIGQRRLEATAPLAADADAAAQAAAMQAALAQVFTEMERWFTTSIPAGATTARRR